MHQLDRQKLKAFRKQLFINNARCWYCGEIVDGDAATLDHQFPLSTYGNFGSNRIDNFVLACPDCNQFKGNKTVGSYRTWLRQQTGLRVIFYGETVENLDIYSICNGSEVFESAEKAHGYLLFRKSKYGDKKSIKMLAPYQCGKCGKFHLITKLRLKSVLLFPNPQKLAEIADKKI